MKAVYISEFGGPEKLEIREVPDPPKPEGNQVLVRVRAAGLNRADLMQRRGSYPPPPGYSPNIPGMEFAGEVAAAGADAKRFRPGDGVFGITAGEAQAEQVVIDESLLAAVPANIELTQAAALPEVFITAHDALFTQADLKAGETLLIHAAGSGVGLAALQLAKARGCRVIGTSRTREKLERCSKFGLDLPIVVDKAPAKFASEVLDNTDGHGADVILDLVGGAYFAENVAGLASRGRLMLVGLTAGRTAEIDLGTLLYKRARVIGTMLRSRSVEEKADAVRRFETDVVPLIASSAIAANVDRIFALNDVRQAHEYMESNESFGKIVLEL
ncbi:MAG TPA: NAD(P)H-quinone oxidoreductase, partial [Pyrinomonadaceae bacterium]|nr:NAD(P)H-quinone oxidoreductase [Pyrinomonadaceae bacterium]